MAQHAVVDRFWIIPALDPLALTMFAAFLVLELALTARRPAYGIALLFLAVPIDFTHAVTVTTISFVKAGLIGVLIGLLTRSDARHAIKTQMPRLVPTAFAAMLLALAISGLGTPHRSEAAVLRELAKWVEFALLFICAYVARFVEADDRPLLGALSIATLLVCASALVEEFTGAPSGLWIQGRAVPRIAGFLEGPNQLGGYLELVLAALLSWIGASSSKRRTLLASLATLTLILTFSRAAYVGALVACIVVCISVPRKKLGVVLAPIAAGIGAGIISVLALVGGQTHVMNATAPLLRNDAAGAGGVGTRNELWRAAWYFFTRHPLFGIGAGNYELRLTDAGLPGIRTHANSWYLQALAEGGLTLFSTTLFFLYATFATLRAGLNRSPWTLAAFAATVALALHQAVDYLVFFHKVGEPWMILIGLGAAAATTPACES